MKKTILLLATLALSAVMFGQITVYNAEDIGAGMFTAFEVPGIDEIDNPDKTGENTTEKCLRISRSAASVAWSGCIATGLDIPNIKEYGTATMLVKKNIAGPVQVEIQNDGNTERDFLRVDFPEDAIGTWKKLTFNVPSNALKGNNIATILISIHRIGDSEYIDDDEFMYIDELVFHPRSENPNYNGEDTGIGMWDNFLINTSEVNNPDKTGLNTTDKCLQLNRVKDTDPWSGARAPRLNVSLAECSEITMMVKKDVAGEVKLELQTWDEGKKEVLTAIYEETNAGEWQKLTFTVPENIFDGDPLGIILLQIHAVDTKTDDNYTDQLMYIDELTFVGVETPGTGLPPVNFDEENIASTNIYTITGVLMASYGNQAVNLSSLQTGIYIVKQTDVNGNIYTRKIAVNGACK